MNAGAGGMTQGAILQATAGGGALTITNQVAWQTNWTFGGAVAVTITSATADDLLVAVCSTSGSVSPTITSPSDNQSGTTGWSQLITGVTSTASINGRYARVSIWIKKAVGGETSVQANGNGSDFSAVKVAQFRASGVSTWALDGTADADEGTANDWGPNAVVIEQDSSLVVIGSVSGRLYTGVASPFDTNSGQIDNSGDYPAYSWNIYSSSPGSKNCVVWFNVNTPSWVSVGAGIKATS